MVDIDHFKEVNDTFGHPTGDKVLQTFAHILKDNIRQIDHIARWGGEEFMLVLPKTTACNAAIVAESIRHNIQLHSFETIGKKTASFGIAQIRNSESIETLVDRVDKALYAAKENGRNQVVIDE
jgi:diguanylate cyclase (GGDEF)-like protein